MPTLAELPPPPPHKSGWPWTAESARFAEVTPAGRRWPRLTVVTPSFNQAEFLEATLRSVLLQCYPDLEYIVMDGGSTDWSQDILEKYRPWLSYVVSEPDGGQYRAIARGFYKSTGAIMTWLNSDDMLAINSLWAVGGIFADLDQSVHWVTGVPSIWDCNDRLALIYTRPKLARPLLRMGAYDGVTLNFIQQEGTFWSRSLWERSGARLETSLAFAADYELWCRLAEQERLYGAAVLLAGFRKHPGQKTAQAMHSYMEEMQRCRCSRTFGWTERRWLARGIRRRIARLIYLVNREDRHQVIFDPVAQRWCVL